MQLLTKNINKYAAPLEPQYSLPKIIPKGKFINFMRTENGTARINWEYLPFATATVPSACLVKLGA